MNIVPLQEKHLEDAAALACARFRALRRQVAHLPSCYEETEVVLPLLSELAGQGPGGAALEGSRLTGFIGAWLVPDFRGARTAYSPEWANAALDAHLAAAPTFLPAEPHDRDWHERWLSDPANALWLAYEGAPNPAEQPVGMLCQEPASTDACTVICDPGTTSIVGAFARPDSRGRGVAAALLQRALEWGRENGYERCAVDFEPMNTLAARFWMRHFAPVCFALARQIAPHVG